MGIAISSKERDLIIQLIKKNLPNTEVWAYGSRITGKSTPSSDLDLVAFSARSQSSAINQLRDVFNESALAFRIDLFVWEDIPDHFKDTIKNQHLVLVKKDT